ncbi:hypothetical protein SCP_0503250 [Sparassis crispa]|uniref:Uncharacterized protein n=1 Tax=Sparassis crispa TaxID=139825 RepID=A0A401GM44_9APHY|nr:hypothetical protein SCP_0503250 [Sparassis crispa]GBE83277.1 hypothetical protein SCP_0503250 [Sparassis crispa]
MEKSNDDNGAPAFNSSSASLFVDVAFIFTVLMQFIFSERTTSVCMWSATAMYFPVRPSQLRSSAAALRAASV